MNKLPVKSSKAMDGTITEQKMFINKHKNDDDEE